MSGAEGCDDQDETASKLLECPVCLQTCVQPISLPCSHIFCFLCAKGIASHSRKCALCRKSIPEGYLNSPAVIEDTNPAFAIEGKYQWFYQGTNGWWQYDPRASSEIEASYQEGKKSLKIMIAGFIYIVDIEKMMQYRENIPSRVRLIKRDLIDIPDRKGIAGLPSRKSAGDKNEAKASGDITSTSSSTTEPSQHTDQETNEDDELTSDMTSLTLHQHDDGKDEDGSRTKI